MDANSIHLHAYSGKENGLMVIGSGDALATLGQQLQAAASFPSKTHSQNWPAEVAVLVAESPYVDRPDFRVSFHIQREPLPKELVQRARSSSGAIPFLFVGALALVGAVSLARLAWSTF